MFRVRQLLPTSQPLCETSVHSASAFTPTRSGRYPFPLFSFSYALFCIDEFPISNLLSKFHTLCTKHPGWGIHPHDFSPNFRLAAPIPFRIRTYEKTTRNPFRIRTSKTQHLKLFRMNTYRKTGEGVPAIPQAVLALCYSQSHVNILSAETED